MLKRHTKTKKSSSFIENNPEYPISLPPRTSPAQETYLLHMVATVQDVASTPHASALQD